MSYTIYKSTSGLIAQPGRTVSTFPSGLVRVEQIYLGLTANAAANRAALAAGNNMPDGDSSPCIDGLKIFPEVQERRREDGFTEYNVTAYGRLKLTAGIENRRAVYTRGAFLTITRKTVTATIVSHSFPSFSELGIPSGAFSPESAFLFNWESGEPEEGSFTLISQTGYWQKYNLVFPSSTISIFFISAGIDAKGEFAMDLPLSLTQRNFGYWNEWIFAYG
jgi:hypothetical protein